MYKDIFIKYLGRAIITPILMMVYPKKYGVLNGRSERDIKRYRSEKIIKRYGNCIFCKYWTEQYPQFNELLKEISIKYKISLFQLDSVFGSTGKKNTEPSY